MGSGGSSRCYAPGVLRWCGGVTAQEEVKNKSNQSAAGADWDGGSSVACRFSGVDYSKHSRFTCLTNC